MPRSLYIIEEQQDGMFRARKGVLHLVYSIPQDAWRLKRADKITIDDAVAFVTLRDVQEGISAVTRTTTHAHDQ